MNQDVIASLRDEILPHHYTRDLSHLVDDDCLLFKKGAYACLAMPFSKVPSEDYGSQYAKAVLRKAMLCLPVLCERGLFLLYYGPYEDWESVAPRFTVDKTALRPVILQAVHFIDPESGWNANSRTHWGPLKFGFCGALIDEIEQLGEDIQQSA